MGDLRLYLRYLGISVRGQLQYRAALWIASFGMFLLSAIELTGIVALVTRFGAVGGFAPLQIGFLYGLCNVSFSLAEALSPGFDYFGGRMVRSGDFDRLLLRPRSPILQLAGQELALRRVGRLSTGLIVLTWTSLRLELDWSLPRVALLLFSIASAAAVFFAIFVFSAALSFWTTESVEVTNTLSHGGREAMQYPLAIYDRWFRRFFMYAVPLGCALYLPSVAILDVHDPLGTSRTVQWLAPLSGPVFLWLSFSAFGIGVRRYTSTGS